MELGMVKSVDWVPTDFQLADCLTKKGTVLKSEWLLAVADSNSLEKRKERGKRGSTYIYK